MYIWDAKKDRLNQKKHGISFEEAKESIFEGKNVIVYGVANQTQGEMRHAVIGRHRGKYYTAIFTIRERVVRIISVRRARHEEEEEARKKGL